MDTIEKNTFSTNSKYKQTTTGTISLTYSPRNQHNSRKKINIKTHTSTQKHSNIQAPRPTFIE